MPTNGIGKMLLNMASWLAKKYGYKKLRLEPLN
jgi:hypothetical protein